MHQLSKNLGFALALLLCLRDSLLSSVIAGRGFPEVADSFVVISWEANCWALAEEGF